jgi:hypothetical protein
MTNYEYLVTTLSIPTPTSVYHTEESFKEYFQFPIGASYPPYWGMYEEECSNLLEGFLQAPAGASFCLSNPMARTLVFTKIPLVTLPEDFKYTYLHLEATEGKLEASILHKEELLEMDPDNFSVKGFTSPTGYYAGRAARISDSELVLHFNPIQVYTHMDYKKQP